ncbi:MAG: hypothetical protein MJZ00_04465 [Paludibacteraceae bacterium]|nr:hypothetical protein [Paludibacteraceae bacterium]
MKQINDPVFGDLEYDESKKAWTKRIPLGIWFGDDYQLDLVVQSDKGVITDIQRDAYKSYLENLQNVKSEFREVLLSYFKDHYEEFNRNWNLPEELNLEVVNSKETLAYFNIRQLFIDRKGNYGWLTNFISERYCLSVILSDGAPKIFKGWTVLKMDYARVDDEVFGEMFFDQGWKRWIKTDINGIDGEWVLVHAAALSGQEITPEQSTNYQKYLQNEEKFLKEFPKVLLESYLDDYDQIAEVWEDADLFNPESMDEESIKDLVELQRLYFNRDGVRYGWLCECAWDSVYGLALYYDGDDELCIGMKEDLLM